MTQSLTPSRPRLTLGTRGSPLALWQAHAVRDALVAAHGWSPGDVAVEVIRTTGDAITDRALAEAGGKGLFTKELEEALLDGRIDLAVHSAKDMATQLPDGLHIAGYLPRADVRDALILREGASLDDLPPGARIGTASLRREAQLRRLRPDLDVSLLRGNVHTRLGKVRDGVFDGTLLALAGLTRLGLADKASAVLPTDAFLPAVGQGAVAIEARLGDAATGEQLAPVLDPATGVAVSMERAFLTELDGSCRTPLAGLARIEGGEVSFRGLLLSPDGREAVEVERRCTISEAVAIGTEAGRDVKARAPRHILPD
ncbi:hydroxymethylbilane synthase [Ancylobacter sp. 6x-1]|uniref:Porphobilinogen deaminase n=1 Tax=Ancylobacter crimeensis TaxID=2579147 RepID=A0ABT0DET4_9HYPH|nr:hydroxymethylbilane synthase [Ancylobacter crimeensis]MCK0198480.1 hydroxymethylbilane synthase [Ancylobacter crimeensis]